MVMSEHDDVERSRVNRKRRIAYGIRNESQSGIVLTGPEEIRNLEIGKGFP